MDFIRTRAQQRGQGGFTLIELLVVIAILAILAGVVIFAVGNSTEAAKTSACKTEKSAAITAVAAAKTAREIEGNTDTPGSYLDTATGNPKYYSWTGNSPATWAASALAGATGVC